MELLLNAVLIIPLFLSFFWPQEKVVKYYLICLIPSQTYYAVIVLLLILIIYNLRLRINLLKNFPPVQWILAIWLAGALYNILFVQDFFRFLTEFASLATGLLLLYNLTDRINSIKDQSTIMEGFFFGSIILAIYAVTHIIMGSPFTQETSALFSISGTFNYTAIYILLGFIVGPVAVFQWSNVSKWTTIIMGFATLYLLESRGAMLVGMLIVFYQYYILQKKHRFFKTILIFLGIYLALFMFRQSLNPSRLLLFSVINFEDNASNLERIELLIYALELFNTNSLGYGIGSTSGLYENFFSTFGNNPPHPHNTIAQILIEMGVLGLLLMLSLIHYSLKLLFKIKRKIKEFPCSHEIKIRYQTVSAVTILLSSYFMLDSLLFNGITTIMTFIMIALILSTYKSISNYNA